MTQEPHDMQAPTGATVQMPCSAQGMKLLSRGAKRMGNGKSVI